MSIDKGMFNFQGVMNKFYGYQPGKDDSEGRAIKNSFMANMVQSGFDAQMAKDMAQQQSQIAQSNMTLAADLEARNTASNMKQEFNYGMQSMGAQYEYQNKFANNQYNRDLGTLAAQGEQYREGLTEQGKQERLTAVVKGEQERENTKIVADADKFGAAVAADASKYGSAVAADASKYASSKDAEASMYSADKQTESNKYVADAQNEGIRITGDETRKTQNNADRLEAGKENRQAARSRSMARSF